jgi:ribonuclease G
MERIIVIQDGFKDKALAVLEDNKVVELHWESLYQEKLVGNIYLGRVMNVLPGMQAAFVDLGIGRNALLHWDDILLPTQGGSPITTRKRGSIRDIIKEGQDLLVEVVKDGTGTKGPRITTRISLPGRYIVLMPGQKHLLLSRRIDGEEERKKIKELAMQYKRPEDGVIVRTAAMEAGPEELEADFRSLEALWAGILAKRKEVSSPALLHRDMELLPAVLRDLLSADVDRILVNRQEAKEEVKGIVAEMAPHLQERVVYQEGDLFELFKVPGQMDEALRRKVWLDCGGYLIIDAAEALTVIDVNTGRFIGSTNLADTALKVNLDAAAEIGRQLRLRNIGGMVVVDFVDMSEESHWAMVLEELERQAKKDRVKTQILGLTKLGLVEISRKKTNKSLGNLWLSNCPYCKGKGKVLKLRAVVGQARQKLFNMAERVAAPIIAANLNAQVALLLIDESLKELEARTGKEIIVIGRKSTHREAIELEAMWSTERLEEQILPLETGQIVRWKGLKPAYCHQDQAVIHFGDYRLAVPLPAHFTWDGDQAYALEITRLSVKEAEAKLFF